MQPSTDESGPLTLNRIRVETALSRFPIHRLARKGNVSIDLQRITENGEADFKWEVSYTAKYGQPGPLAYKIDTLIVNRRVDEARRPLPELIRLGSLTDICNEMGMVDSGENRAHIRKALLQNAFAAITAKIRYKTRSGTEKWAEIGYTRYSVIFTGEILPDGNQADAVYAILNPPYRDLLNQVEMRPLDYDYLRLLAPGSQRFYELASFQIFGAIASGRARAKIVYSSYCQHAPQMRYPDFEHVKKQMYKVHLPHRESGYIVKVDYEKTTNKAGEADWDMFYTPGPKAFAEYRAFTTKQANAPFSLRPVSTVSRLPKTNASQSTVDLTTLSPVAAELLKRGISAKVTAELLNRIKPGQEVVDQIEYFDHVKSADVNGRLASPTGFLVSLIRENIPVPETFPTSRKSKLDENQRAITSDLEFRYEAYRKQQIQEYLYALPAPERDVMRQENSLLWEGMPSDQREEMTELSIYSAVAESGKIKIKSFKQWKSSVGC